MGLYQVDQQCLGLKLVFTSGIAACRGHWQHALQLLADMQDADSLSLSLALSLSVRDSHLFVIGFTSPVISDFSHTVECSCPAVQLDYQSDSVV